MLGWLAPVELVDRYQYRYLKPESQGFEYISRSSPKSRNANSPGFDSEHARELQSAESTGDSIPGRKRSSKKEQKKMGLGWQELLIILVIVIVLFGSRRIPEVAKGLGEGIRSFKSGLQGEPKEETRNYKEEQGSKR